MKAEYLASVTIMRKRIAVGCLERDWNCLRYGTAEMCTVHRNTF